MDEYIDPANPNRMRTALYYYDTNGLNLLKKTVTGATSGGTITYEYSYDTLGRLTSKTLLRRNSANDPTLVPVVFSYTYDGVDRLTTVTDPSGRVFQNVYDASGHVIQVIGNYTGADGTVTTRSIVTRNYDLNDRLLSESDVYGNTTWYGYDASGNLVVVWDPNGHETSYEYDSMNRRTAVTDANGNTSQTVYDLAGRAVQTINPNGKIMKMAMTKLGRPVLVTDALGYQTQFGYDPNGNLTSMIDADGIAGTQPKNSYGATVYRQYDELNRVKSETDALNGTTQYTHDLLGNITSITDANGNTTWFDHDDLGRVVTVRDPLYATTGLATTITYDEAGNALTRTSRSGAQAITGPVPDQNYIYSFIYDQKNRLTQKTDSRAGLSISFAYDPAGNVASKTNYDGSVTQYRYDDANRLVAEQNQGYLEVSYQYDGAGRLLNRILSNGAITSYNWDDDDRLASLTNATVTGVMSSATYQRDKVGNITSRTDASGVTYFTYDPLYRLTPRATARCEPYGPKIVLPCDVQKDDDITQVCEPVRQVYGRLNFSDPCRRLCAAGGAAQSLPDNEP